MRLGNIIKNYRKEHAMSLRDFADKCGISHSYIARLETGIDPRNGKPVEPTVEVVARIASAMGMTLDELLQRTGYLPESGAIELEDLLRREMLLFQGQPIDEEAKKGIAQFIKLVQEMSAKRVENEKPEKNE